MTTKPVEAGARRTSRRLALVLIGATALLAVVGEAGLLSQQSMSHPQARIGGPFSLVDADGRRVGQADLLGKPTVLFFGFTGCPEVCPTTLTALTAAMKTLGSKADGLNVVFVSVDPQHDTPEQLKLYLSSFDPRIRGFTGSEGEVASMAKAYHALYHRVALDGGGYTMEHTATLLLFDARGGLAGTIAYGEDEKWIVKRLARLTG